MPYMRIYLLQDGLHHIYDMDNRGHAECGVVCTPDTCIRHFNIGSIGEDDPPRDQLCPVCFPPPSLRTP